jgi:hypothetical protein
MAIGAQAEVSSSNITSAIRVIALSGRRQPETVNTFEIIGISRFIVAQDHQPALPRQPPRHRADMSQRATPALRIDGSRNVLGRHGFAGRHLAQEVEDGRFQNFAH